MQAILGTSGALVMAAAIVISTFSCNNGLILAGARVYYAMARDGLFFSPAGTVNARHVPAVALLTQGVWASLLILPRTVRADSAGSIVYGNIYTQLLEYIISTELVFYALMIGAVIVLRRRRPAADRPVPDHRLSSNAVDLHLDCPPLGRGLGVSCASHFWNGIPTGRLGHSCLSRAPPWRGPAVANRRGRDATNAGR